MYACLIQPHKKKKCSLEMELLWKTVIAHTNSPRIYNATAIHCDFTLITLQHDPQNRWNWERICMQNSEKKRILCLIYHNKRFIIVRCSMYDVCLSIISAPGATFFTSLLLLLHICRKFEFDLATQISSSS